MCASGTESLDLLLRAFPECEENLALMRQVDELYLERGSRSIRDALGDRGFTVGRHRIRRLIRRMGLVAVYLEEANLGSEQSAQDSSVPASQAED